jgi:membrane fusion protein (multidrug efflux system)
MEKKKQIKKFIYYPSSFGSFRCIIRDIQIHAFLAHEETDDAQIEKKMNYIPRVSGYVDKVVH